MANYPKKRINKGLIVLNKGERIAVITLLTIIACLLGFSLFRPVIPLTRHERHSFHNLDSMMAAHSVATPPQEPTPTTIASHPSLSTPNSKPSTPNSKPSTLNSKTTLNSQPSTLNSQPSTLNSKTTLNSQLSTLNFSINTADSTELIALPQIGEVMASRIHRYRDRLGGYLSLDQLLEVKGMTQERFETIRPYLLLDPKEVRHLNVNQEDFKTLLRHPYLKYEQVKAIVNHRERKGYIRNWNEFQEIVGEVNPLLESYLTY